MNKSFNVDNLKVVISDNPNNMGRAAAEAIHRDINDLLAVKEEISIMFAAAPSQNTTLAFLSSYDDIEWRRVRVFHMDEYIGPAEDSPNSFRYYLNSHFWSGRLFKAKYQIMGDAKDPAEEARHYSALLKEYPIDLVDSTRIGADGTNICVFIKVSMCIF